MSSDSSTAAYTGDPHAAIALLLRALERMPGNVDAFVGLAGLHLQIGALDEATQWLARAAAASPVPPTVARLRTAIAESYVDRGTHQAIDGRIDLAIETLARGAALADARAAGLFRDLFLLSRAWSSDAAHMASTPGAIRFGIPVWGETYVESMCDGLLRSLLAPGNIPALAGKAAIILEFTTRERDRQALESSPVIAALRAYATIAYAIIPDHLVVSDAPRDFSYWLMSAGHYGSAERARCSGSAISFLTVDMVLSDGSLSAAHRHITEGFEAVLVRALELDRSALEGARGSSAPLVVAPDELVRIALAQVRAELTETWGGGVGAPFDIASCAWFPIEGGVAVHGFHFLPLLGSPALIGRAFAFDMLTVDTRFMRLALGEASPSGRVKVVDDAREIAVVSTLRDARSAPGARQLNGERLGRWGAGWCFTPADAAYFDWCFRHRTVYRPGRSDPAPPPAAQEREMVSEVLKAYVGAAAAQLMRRNVNPSFKPEAPG